MGCAFGVFVFWIIFPMVQIWLFMLYLWFWTCGVNEHGEYTRGLWFPLILWILTIKLVTTSTQYCRIGFGCEKYAYWTISGNFVCHKRLIETWIVLSSKLAKQVWVTIFLYTLKSYSLVGLESYLAKWVGVLLTIGLESYMAK